VLGPQVGLRERKKDRTRRALADAAMRLFAERGYEDTTIADLAASAEVSLRTFYSYFPAKEDVLFADLDARLAAMSELDIRHTGEPLPDAIRRIGAAVVNIVTAYDGDQEAATRQRIISSRPALQGAGFLRVWVMEQRLAESLRAAFPDKVDDILAAAVVGALVSALRTASHPRPGSRPSRRSAQKVIDRVVQLFEHGFNR
jgi:AcrR family transcriptional regulator